MKSLPSKKRRDDIRENRRYRYDRFLAVSMVALFIFVCTVYGQSSTNYIIETYVISGGGGEGTSTNYDLLHIIGQPSAVGASSSTNYIIHAGFLKGEAGILNPLNDTNEFVKQQYRDFLNREAETVGLQHWVNIIDTGVMTRAQVIESFFWSNEFGLKIAPIVRLYFAYFLRIPDYGGLMYWIDAYNSGSSLGDISDAFAGSEEFRQRYGSLSNEGFVNLIYQNILGRAPDSGGYAFWVGELNSGRRTRGQVMVGFSESNEYKETSSHEVFVTMMYVGMLRRSPEQGGFDWWVNYLDLGNSGLALIDGFLYSQEYADRFK